MVFSIPKPLIRCVGHTFFKISTGEFLLSKEGPVSTNRLRNAVSWLDTPSDYEYPVTAIKSGVVREESNEALWDHYHNVAFVLVVNEFGISHSKCA
jgi:hypothetical protein